MKKDSLKIWVAIIVLCFFIVVSLVYSVLTEDMSSNTTAGRTEAETILEAVEEETESTSVTHLRDISTLYETESDDVVTMYLTVKQGNSTEGTDHTWEEINTFSAYYYDELGIDRYKVEGLLQIGDETGVLAGMLGYGRTTPNATVQIRGQSSSTNAQKNYKIELKENQGSWNGQTTIALNKHQTDGLRFRNKLGFDLLSGIEELMSLRTQFVHLYVDDETEGSGSGFEDYGLYTQVEQLNKTSLKTHGLDKNGQLYKINYFEFYRYEDVIKLTSDPDYDEDAFEEYLEIKGDTDHSKLIAMLDDLNDYTIPIETVIEEHFDEENLVYWMAFNILTGNADTQSRNAYLYSAQNEDTWYLLCWDLDGIFRTDENEVLNRSDYESWEQGVSNYWGNVLFQRCLKSSEFREALDAAIEDLKSYMTEELLTEMVEEYRAVVEESIYSSPDVTYAPLTQSEYDYVADHLPSLVDTYYENYKQSLENPMPFFIGTPELVDGMLNMGWDASYDFQEDDITYHAILARDLALTDVITEYDGSWTEISVEAPEAGQYFLKVQAIDEDGNTMDAFDYYETDEDGKYYGILCFYINEDGTISVYETVEE